MKVHSLLLCGVLATAAVAGAASAATAPAAPARPRSCFFSRDWESWRAPNKDTIYLRVSFKNFYRVDLSSGSDLLTWPDSHIISEIRGSSTICSPLDLDLSVSDGHGIRQFLI